MRSIFRSLQTNCGAITAFGSILVAPRLLELRTNDDTPRPRYTQLLQQYIQAVTEIPTTSLDSKAFVKRFSTRSNDYDFIILGYGNCGAAALAKLRQECPGARIALVDPIRRPKKDIKVDFYSKHATRLDTRHRKVQIEHETLRYKHSLLIATGAHGAPPPSYLFDENAREHILELRPTMLPGQRPILHPEQVRNRTIQASKQKQTVAILGSGWDAIDLAIASSSHKKNHTLLMFGSAGPASNILPSYLSSAMSKRLHSRKIQILDRTLVRYVSENTHGDTRLQLYTAKTYDFLDSHRYLCDLVTIAPDIAGIRGNGCQATNNVPEFLEESRAGRSWYMTWSNLSMTSPMDPPTLTCYKDDGRIAVNTELMACTGVYAAGSVAKYANGLTGHSDVAGVGFDEGNEAGVVAAANMSLDFKKTTSVFTPSRSYHEVKDPIPVWRSDICSYTSEPTKSMLEEIGVSCLALGHCESERFRTHAIWWTNQSAQTRMMNMFDDEISKKEKKARLKEASKSVYGIGCIFYLDRTGRIQGIMTWGLPYTDSKDQLNPRLVTEMQRIIRTNGDMGSVNTELDYVRLSKYLEDESRKLVAIALSHADESMESDMHMLDGHHKDFPRPLHRLTEVRAASVRSAGVVKRKDAHGQGILGEDMFCRYENPVEDAPPPKPIAGVGYADTQNTSSNRKSLNAANDIYDWQLWEQREKRFDENEATARPPKEDALWIRKGDEVRNTSARENLAAAYSAASSMQRLY